MLKSNFFVEVVWLKLHANSIWGFWYWGLGFEAIKGLGPFLGFGNSKFLKAALKLYPKKGCLAPFGSPIEYHHIKGFLKFDLSSFLSSPPKKDEFASSSSLIPMLPLPAPAKLPLHDSECFSETPQGEPGSVFQLPQIPVVHSKKCPNCSSPPQIRDEPCFNVSSMNYEFTRGFSKCQGQIAYFFSF
jgi:hypothetical protein